MTTVSGNNVTITSSDIVGSTQGLIIRTPTTNSSDTLDTASSIILAYFGINTTEYDGDSFFMRIYNNSPNIITFGPGTGITILPTSSDTILPQATHTYLLVKTSGTTLNCYMTSNANAADTTGISLASGNIIVGSTLGIGTEVTMSSDATIAASGILTLANTGVSATSYTNTNLTVDSKGRITAASNGSSSLLPSFYAYGPTAVISISAITAFTTLTAYNAPTFDAGIYSYSAGVVTILAAGTYEICYTVQFNSNGNTGASVGLLGTQILKSGSSIAGSVTECNVSRLAGTSNRSFNSKSWIDSAAVNTTYAIQWSSATNTSVQITQNQTVFTIKRLQ